MNKLILIAALVAVVAAKRRTDVAPKPISISKPAPVSADKSVIDTSLACSVSDHIHSTLLNFEGEADKTVTVTTALLETKTAAYNSQKKVTVKAVSAHGASVTAMNAANKNYAQCMGVQKTFQEELAAQTPVIKNELECIASIQKSVEALGDVPADESTDLLEVPEEFAETQVAAAVNVLLERKDGMTGETVEQLKSLLESLSAKLENELEALRAKVSAQIAKCDGLRKVKTEAIASHTVALGERTLQEKNLANADKEVKSAEALLAQVTQEQKDEVAIVGQVRSSTTKVCKGKKVKTTTNVCSASDLIADLFKKRTAEHSVHVAQLGSFKSTMAVEQQDLGEAKVDSAEADEISAAADSAFTSCMSALATKKSELDNARKVIGRERALIKIIGEKAQCVKDATRKTRTDCSDVKKAIKELQESSSTDATETTLLALGRDHVELGEIAELLQTLDTALVEELEGYQMRWSKQVTQCKARKAQKEAATDKKAAAAAALKQAIKDFAAAKSSHDAYVVTLAVFNKERMNEAVYMKKAQSQLTTLAKTKFGSKWAGCTAEEEDLEEDDY